MAENKTPRIAIAVPPAYREHLEAMSAESGLTLTGLMASMLLSIVDDDREAHGMEPLSRDGYVGRGRGE